MGGTHSFCCGFVFNQDVDIDIDANPPEISQQHDSTMILFDGTENEEEWDEDFDDDDMNTFEDQYCGSTQSETFEDDLSHCHDDQNSYIYQVF